VASIIFTAAFLPAELVSVKETRQLLRFAAGKDMKDKTFLPSICCSVNDGKKTYDVSLPIQVIESDRAELTEALRKAVHDEIDRQFDLLELSHGSAQGAAVGEHHEGGAAAQRAGEGVRPTLEAQSGAQ
jgi:hypothetical protein